MVRDLKSELLCTLDLCFVAGDILPDIEEGTVRLVLGERVLDARCKSSLIGIIRTVIEGKCDHRLGRVDPGNIRGVVPVALTALRCFGCGCFRLLGLFSRSWCYVNGFTVFF